MPHVHVLLSGAAHKKLMELKEILKKINLDETVEEIVKQQYEAEAQRQ